MKLPKQQLVFTKTIVALSVLLAVGAAYADDDEVMQLIKNESSVSVGAATIGGTSKDRSIFGQYNGYRNNQLYPLLDFSIIKLDDKTGLWTRAEGHNLGQDNRELSFLQNRQGDWKYSFDYSEITHHDMRTLNTAMQGAGTTSPTVTSLATPGTGADINLQLQRQAITLSGDKWITPHLLLETSFKNENKTGARLSGEGMYCSPGTSGLNGPNRYLPCSGASALLLLPEPVSTNTRQLDAKLSYSGSKFLVSGGYYGSFFSNSNQSYSLNPSSPYLTSVSAGLASYLTAPIALQPDNQSQQLFVSGNYTLTPTTHSTFKYAYTHATQSESFSSMGLTGPAGVGNLGGVVDTNLAQFGLTARPMSKLTLRANVRYEDKNDKTPLAGYSTLNTGTTTLKTYTNNYSNSSTKLNGKLEAKYQLPDNYNATLGVDYASVQRAAPPSITDPASGDMALSLAGLRENTREVSWRAELRRSLTDKLNGMLGYTHSQRNGDSWTMYNTTGILPMTMMDRKRDKIKMSADWTPISKLSLQFNFENGKDSYSGPMQAGMRDTNVTSYGVDAALNLSEKWKLTGYANQSLQTLHISQIEVDDSNTSLGCGVAYKPTGRLDLGGSLSYMNDINRYINGQLPDVKYRVSNLKLFSKYAVQKNADVRVDYVHQHAKLDEWTWGSGGTPFAYSDKTTVSMQPSQAVDFLGASYVYKFR